MYKRDDGITVLSHDPFGRFERIRRTVPKEYRKPCAWCGSRPGRFEYGSEPDDNARNRGWQRGAFCSESCSASFAR